jgi:ribonucleoside-diphosphate reductase alpha chain
MKSTIKVTSRTTYTREEALTAALNYFKNDDLAASVWLNKYALKDSDGNIYERTPNDMHERIAKEIARVEKKYENPLTASEIFEVIKDFKYIVPQGSPMAGIGNTFQVGSLSNCFVIGNDGDSDSYGGIMKIDQEQVQLMKRRGGVGHDLSHIRPKGSPVKNSALTSTGIVPFMERYSNSTREVAQDGRRGALMLSVSINHPDSEDFIDAKLEQGKVTGANVSVRIDDAFMKAVKKEGNYIQKYPVFSTTPKVSKTVPAKKLWKKIVHNAWKSAEPGILFWDTIINESVPDCYADLGYKTVSTNPCGEIPLCPYDSCRLLAINLFSYVENPFTEKATFNFELFKKHIIIAQRMMDDIIDLELEKIDKILEKIESDPELDNVKATEKNLWLNIREKAYEGRRTGIGITAEGDMLAALGIRYGSEEGNDFSEKVHKVLGIETYRASVNLAKERGAFSIYNSEREKENPFILRLKEADSKLYYEMLEHGRRNIALLTIAPTGTTSLMTQTSSGIEPVFMPVYKRRKKSKP